MAQLQVAELAQLQVAELAQAMALLAWVEWTEQAQPEVARLRVEM